jgi:hypothetical protein
LTDPAVIGQLGTTNLPSLQPGVLDNVSFTTQQLWVQTASSEIVCIFGNASFELGFEYVDGIQSLTRNITDFNPVYML